MNIELEARPSLSVKRPRVLAVGAALTLFLLHRLGASPVEDFFEWLLVVLPALELSSLAGLAALVADGDGGKESTIGRWAVGVAALRWFGFVVAANWVLAIFVAASLEAYVRLGGPPMIMLPV